MFIELSYWLIVEYRPNAEAAESNKHKQKRF